MSKKGVAFGADGHVIPWSDLTNDLRKKGPFYCVFFDTACLRREPGNETYDSIQEILTKSDPQELKTQAVQQGGNGSVSFSAPAIPKRAFWMVDYRFEAGEWKISSMWNIGKLPHYGAGELAAPGSKDEDLEGLEAAGWRLIALLKDGNPQDLPKLCWRKGVTIDLDGTTVPPATLAKMIAEKNWFYCAYFDSNCYHQSGIGSAQRYSYRDLLRNAKSVRLDAAVRARPERNKSGVITLQIDGGPAKEQLEEREYNFIFTLDDGAWKLTCLECDPDFVL